MTDELNEPIDPMDDGVVSSVEIDRMVDGELSDAEQQELLRRLDLSAGGWRRLALAYVEDSVFASQFGRLAPGTRDGFCDVAVTGSRSLGDVDPARAGSEAARKSGRSMTSSVQVLLTAAVLFAFGAGLWLGRGQGGLADSPSVESPEMIVDDEGTESIDVNEGTFNDDQAPKTAIAEHSASAHEETEPGEDRVPDAVQVVFGDQNSGLLQVLEVPVAETTADSRDLSAVWNRRGAVSPQIRAALEKTGHRIVESRNFWPAVLPDGRPVVIPVNQVHVTSSVGVYP